MCEWISSSRSWSSCRRRKGPSKSYRSHDKSDRLHKKIPFRSLSDKMSASLGSEAVVLGPLFVFRKPPFGRDHALTFQAVKGRIQGTRLDIEKLAGARVYGLPDPMAMLTSPSKSLQDQHVE